jgi:regulator of protease activity HflC (stomatin/prohibitin superfamily)
VSNLLQAQGQAQAANQLGQANIMSNVLQQGIGAAAYGGAFSPTTAAPQFNTAQSFASPTNNRLMMNRI